MLHANLTERDGNQQPESLTYIIIGNHAKKKKRLKLKIISKELNQLFKFS